MKNILCISLLLFTVSLSWAQVTEKDLQGNWKLIIYNVKGASLDITTGKVTLTETDNSIMAAMGVKLKSDMESYTEGLRRSELEIKDNNFYQVIADFARSGLFTITEKEGQQYISAKFDNGTSDEIPFKIIDGNLYLQAAKGAKMYIYSKI